ncbi:MAG: MBL fold metallo-hydrolase [Proteobacteria bacterium]|nr:MBL fold metallo-hydrolase [Pseudomonadota bacterium]
MKIKVWGCRGSITTPGLNTLRYGGNSTCLEIRSVLGQVFVVDAGSGLRNLGKALRQEEDISDVRFFLTHPHWDHLVGFPFFEPAYSDHYNITFCSGPHSQDAIRRYLSRQMEAPYFPIDFKYLKANFNYRCDQPKSGNGNCMIGSMEFCAFPLNHPGGGYGFKFVESGKAFVFLSDNELGFQHKGGLSNEQYVAFCRDVDLLFHDAQYTAEEYKHTRGWGHSTYKDATDLAIDAGVKRFGLFHHDPDRTDDDMDQQADYCREQISRAGSPAECFPCAEGMVVEL